MRAQEIEQYLQALDQALVDQGIITPLPVLLLGGAYIAITVNTRRATNDIDVYPFIGSERDQATGIPLAVALHQAIQMVAERLHLHPLWFNTIRLGALQPSGYLPQKRRPWRKYRVLEVSLPEPEYVLLQKLLVHRQKDRPDISALFRLLGITDYASAQALLDRYISQGEQQQRRLPLLLRSYFRE
ncbi:hypothetical protein EI42_04729 [Thermosporothrix hazakensis]|jgi:hypothetical protein|uniref:Nucleotidyltransferase AbiEii toxin of type IV toxin-antitoxin system n=2 Tax=Thermosporothrix TaxID=768650 RepID=A0A326U0S2_THEHA|nr:hypothetical protein [Thermosporothrix hazakensis]PZW24038.1 hypothetical protein EI42_04729 [Thermosporothrix hazakensis]BBH87825.1 hypothetical protein KTC_25760 [Thermosporothrix sp. COM3]